MLTGSLRSSRLARFPEPARPTKSGRSSVWRAQRGTEVDSSDAPRVHPEVDGVIAWPTQRRQSGSIENVADPVIDIFPLGVAARRTMAWRGMLVELVHTLRRDRTEIRYRGPRHLLMAHEQGARLEGETLLDGVPRSSLRDVKRKLTFVPAGHDYRDWQEPRVLARTVYIYFDPAEMPIDPAARDGNVEFTPRLLFDNGPLWETVSKLATLIQTGGVENSRYCEALGVVLAHEIVRLNLGAPSVASPVRGGLAAWQQRIVTAYIDEHLAEPIPLAKLAGLVRLSPAYFCRSFKQSFGTPPHRYHSSRRIERAKALLAERKHSVTEIGLELGFSETSAFTATFRKLTGLTPTAYHRSLA
jgi:AraC family transcriptional regulator